MQGEAGKKLFLDGAFNQMLENFCINKPEDLTWAGVTQAKRGRAREPFEGILEGVGAALFLTQTFNTPIRVYNCTTSEKKHNHSGMAKHSKCNSGVLWMLC